MEPDVRKDNVESERSFIRRMLFGGNTRNTMIRVGVLVLFCVVIFGWVLKPIRVTGISMLPTYKDQSLNFVNLLSYKSTEPQRGDVVSIRDVALPESDTYMKRIIVLPGETFSINNGYVFINGEPLDEPYVVFRENWQMKSQKLGAEEYLVIGDNRGMRQDAHKFGRVERKHFIGKVLF